MLLKHGTVEKSHKYRSCLRFLSKINVLSIILLNHLWGFRIPLL